MGEELTRLAARPGVTVARMSDANDDLDFRDEVHPKPRVARLWAEQLAKALEPAHRIVPARADDSVQRPAPLNTALDRIGSL